MTPSPRRIVSIFAWLVGTVLAIVAGASSATSLVEFTESERYFIESHGPWPPPVVVDPGNRFSGDPRAVELGERLFSDVRLAAVEGMACEFCHRRDRAFTDGLVVGVGRQVLARNTPTLFNLAYNRWFGWDGAADSLWAQSIRPIIAQAEMNADAGIVRRLFETDPIYRTALSGMLEIPVGELGDDAVLALAGKLLAAFQETLVTPRTPFDEFRDALLSADMARAARYPLAAQRGLKLFTGEGQCSLCHFGPSFTNGEFANIGISHMIPNDGVDRGRLAGMRKLKESVFNLTGPFNDDVTRANAVGTRQLRFRHTAFGEFRVPGLRGVAATAPYMHNGSLATLEEVVRHYSELDMDRLHVHGGQILRPLHLSDEQIGDLVAFLESLGATPPGNTSQSGQVIEKQQYDGHAEQ